MQTHFPLILDLTGKSCLVVGGGEVATRRIESLLHAHAEITVIAPEVSQEIAEWSQLGKVSWQQVAYSSQAVTAYTLVVAATDHPEVNYAIWEAVHNAGGWINIVDRPDLCNFIVPSMVQRGKLMIAISTSGASPGLSRKIRKKVEAEYGLEYESYVEFLAQIRQRVMQTVTSAGVRKQIFQELLDERFVQATDEERYLMAEMLIREKTGISQL